MEAMKGWRRCLVGNCLCSVDVRAVDEWSAEVMCQWDFQYVMKFFLCKFSWRDGTFKWQWYQINILFWRGIPPFVRRFSLKWENRTDSIFREHSYFCFHRGFVQKGGSRTDTRTYHVDTDTPSTSSRLAVPYTTIHRASARIISGARLSGGIYIAFVVF